VLHPTKNSIHGAGTVELFVVGIVVGVGAHLILLTNGESVVLVDTQVQLCVVEWCSFPLVNINSRKL